MSDQSNKNRRTDRGRPDTSPDEIMHTVTHPETGETREVTQREYLETYLGQGWQKQDGDDEAEAGPQA